MDRYNFFQIILLFSKISELLLLFAGIRKQIVRCNGMDNTSFCGSIYVRCGQWYFTHVLATLLCGCLRRSDAGDIDDDPNFQADAHSCRTMHGKDRLFSNP